MNAVETFRRALEADAAFRRELVRVYGAKRARHMRYVADHVHTDPALVAAMNAKLAADKAWAVAT